MDLGLNGRTALVTGGSQGIGRATAQLLSEEGCNLAARTQASLDTFAASLPTPARTVSVDLSREGAAEELAARFPDVDILVNNAGAIPGGTIDQISETEWRAAWELKLFGYIAMCRSFYPLLKARGGGVIVNVVGIGGQLRDPRYICGATANAALIAFSQTLASESHRDNIRVVIINPGAVATERLASLDKAMRSKDGGSAFPDLPFDRPASPEEIAAAIAFAASPRSAYTNGAVINVDGGYSLRASFS